MATLAENATAVKLAQVAIDAAIVTKGGTTGGGLGNAAKAIINLPAGLARKDINFYGHREGLVYSYSKEEVLADGWDVPFVPTADGLTANGWNASRDRIRSIASSVGFCDVDAMYYPSDSGTHVFLEITSVVNRAQKLRIGLGRIPGASSTAPVSIDIDWGDGTTHYTYDAPFSLTDITHTYATVGNYEIKILTNDAGSLIVGGDTSNKYNLLGGKYSNDGGTTGRTSVVKHVVMSPTATVGAYAFNNLIGLRSLVLPSNDCFADYLCAGDFALQGVSYSLDYSSSQIISIGRYTFHKCSALGHFSFADMLSKIGQHAFDSCSSLQSVTIEGNGVLVFDVGDNAFVACTSLKRVAAPSFGKNMFLNDLAIEEVVVNSVSAYSGEGVGMSAFSGCYGISEVRYNAGVGSNFFLADQSFLNCWSLRRHDFSRVLSVPKLNNRGAFFAGSSPLAEMEIVVPEDLYVAWTTSTNWSDSTIKPHIITAGD